VITSLQVNLDQAGLDHLLKAPSGVVQTFMRRTTERTADEARRRVPVLTGRLQRSIVIRRGAMGSWEVLAETRYAYIIHEGLMKKSATPTRIRKNGGVRVTVKKKGSGKGSKPQRFLMDALRDIIGSLD